MGNTLYSRLFGREEYRILFMGLDAAGKTTMLYKLTLGEVVTTIPTIGFNVETVKYKNIEFNMWDVGTRDKSRSLMKHYFPGTQGLVFVIDSNDRERFDEGMEELCELLAGEKEFENLPVLAVANKQDLQNALSPAAVGAHIVEKNYLQKHPWCVFGASATSKDGQQQLHKGLDWLASQVTRQRKQQFYDEHMTQSKQTGSKSENSGVPGEKAEGHADVKHKDVSNMTFITDFVMTVKSWIKS